MNQEYTQKLLITYPLLFRNTSEDMPSSFQNWGFQCGSGWFELINQLCVDIESVARRAGIAPNAWPNVRQVKEKFGGLRFYVDLSGLNQSLLADGPSLTAIRKLISTAEDQSLEICEDCGLHGQCYEGSWIHVKCPACEAELKKKKEE